MDDSNYFLIHAWESYVGGFTSLTRVAANEHNGRSRISYLHIEGSPQDFLDLHVRHSEIEEATSDTGAEKEYGLRGVNLKQRLSLKSHAIKGIDHFKRSISVIINKRNSVFTRHEQGLNEYFTAASNDEDIYPNRLQIKRSLLQTDKWALIGIKEYNSDKPISVNVNSLNDQTFEAYFLESTKQLEDWIDEL